MIVLPARGRRASWLVHRPARPGLVPRAPREGGGRLMARLISVALTPDTEVTRIEWRYLDEWEVFRG